ncbi:hypothetical protein R1flu_026001 [Riccia fluitans]|uniref:Uncharacterized protein n=1 Tax=Riccia fluitans TaxID=41844 RepID=A0ABD1XFG7_9MARC
MAARSEMARREAFNATDVEADIVEPKYERQTWDGNVDEGTKLTGQRDSKLRTADLSWAESGGRRHVRPRYGSLEKATRCPPFPVKEVNRVEIPGTLNDAPPQIQLAAEEVAARIATPSGSTVDS